MLSLVFSLSAFESWGGGEREGGGGRERVGTKTNLPLVSSLSPFAVKKTDESWGYGNLETRLNHSCERV